MNPPVFIDTSYVLALVNKRDRYYTQALTADQHFAQAGFRSVLVDA